MHTSPISSKIWVKKSALHTANYGTLTGFILNQCYRFNKIGLEGVRLIGNNQKSGDKLCCTCDRQMLHLKGWFRTLSMPRQTPPCMTLWETQRNKVTVSSDTHPCAKTKGLNCRGRSRLRSKSKTNWSLHHRESDSQAQFSGSSFP